MARMKPDANDRRVIMNEFVYRLGDEERQQTTAGTCWDSRCPGQHVSGHWMDALRRTPFPGDAVR